MEILRSVASFGTPVDDLKNIYILFIRSMLEQSATVWHSSLTEENASDLERVQKSAVKVILDQKYNGYQNGLAQLGLENLRERRENICLEFARKCVKNKKLDHMFPKNVNNHSMETRNKETYLVQHANTERLQKSAIIHMQKLLNEYDTEHNQS